MTPRRGPKANPAVAQRNRDAQLTREIVRLRRQLERAVLAKELHATTQVLF